MKKLKYLLCLVLIAYSCFIACKNDFFQCDSTLLDISNNNYTIEIVDGSAFQGKYIVTDSIIKKVTKQYTYYYFKNDDYRYYRGVNAWNKSKDNNEISKTLSTIKDFFKLSKYLYTNKDNSIFKTKTGNLVYNINSTKINLENFDMNTKNFEINNLSTYQNYVVTDYAIKINSLNELIYYIKKPSGILKFSYKNSQWTKEPCDIESLEIYKETLLETIGKNLINESNIYLSTSGITIKDYNGSLYTTFPSISNSSYTLKDFSNNKIYSVTTDCIKISNGTKFNAYKKIDNTIYKFTNDNYNEYITKEICTEYTSLNSIIFNIVKNFAFSFSNNSSMNYIIISETTDDSYELSKINTTNISIMNNAEKVDNIEYYLYNKNYTLKDKKNNITYTKTETMLEIYSTNMTEYFSLENNIVYHYTQIENDWKKNSTTHTSLNSVINFTKLFADINQDKILKLDNNYFNKNFESDNFEITNYNTTINITLPQIN